jgi:hypothetical protein
MTALPSSVFLGLMMISKSIPHWSITRFKAIQKQSARMVEQGQGDAQTLEIDPEIVCVEDLEFTDCAELLRNQAYKPT